MKTLKLVLNFAWRAALIPLTFVAIGLAIGAGSEEVPGLAYATPPVVTASTPDAERYVVFGDSTAEFLGRAMMGLDVNVVNLGLRRCPFRPDLHSTSVRNDVPIEPFHVTPEGAREGTSCAWRDYLPEHLDAIDGATVVLYAAPVMEGPFDDGDILDARFQLTLIRELQQWLDAVDSAKQVILVLPPQSQAALDAGHRYWHEPERHANWLAVLRIVHEVRPDTCLVDYESYHATQPENRPDGSHMEGPGAVAAARWILTQAKTSC